MQAMTVRRGLNSNDIATLNDVIDTSRNIADACEAMGQGAQTGPLAGVGAEATKLVGQAEQMLKTDYATGGTNVMMPPAVQPGQQQQPSLSGGTRRGQ
jgi:hypothetical protein